MKNECLKSITIYGSCVSRDVLEFQEHPILKLVDYFARQSIVSTVSVPVEISEEKLLVESPFQKRMILHDFRKDTFKCMAENRSDYLLIDLIDERFPVAKISDSLVTFSNELAVSGYIDESNLHFKTKQSGFWQRLFHKDEDVWKIDGKLLGDYISKFCDEIKCLYKEEQIIVHEVYLSDYYIDEEGKKTLFPENHLLNNKRTNDLYRYMYGELYKYLPCAERINVSLDYCADVNHKWGLQPMHFQKEYYKDVLRRIMQISCGYGEETRNEQAKE